MNRVGGIQNSLPSCKPVSLIVSKRKDVNGYIKGETNHSKSWKNRIIYLDQEIVLAIWILAIRKKEFDI